MTLIEAMVAMVVFAVVSSAMILLTLQILSTAFSSRQKNQAITYGEQMMEQVRGYYQVNGWAALSSQARSPNPRCLVSVSPWTESATACPSSYPPTDCSIGQIPQTNFFRYLLLLADNTNYFVKATVVVCWQEKAQLRSTIVESYFYSY